MSNSNIEDENQKIRIKKYGNRRLYDVKHKRYITQYQLMEMIREGYEVQIIDSKTGDDLTQAVLTQLILEYQKENPALFSSRMLHQLIQCRERYVEEFFQDYLPNILQSYIEWQQETQSQFMRLAKLGWFQSQQYSRDFFMPGMDLWKMSSSHVKSTNGGTASQTEPPSPESERPSEKCLATSRCKAMRSRAVIKTNQEPNEHCELGIGAQNRSLHEVNEDSSTAATEQMPSISAFQTDSEEIEQLKKKVNELENRLNKIPE